jgi:hypothetical protein
MGVDCLIEQGMRFTGVARRESDKKNLVIKTLSGYNGYVKKNLRNNIEVYSGVYYRFKVVAGPFCRRWHLYYLCVAERQIEEGESLDVNVKYRSR